MEKADVVVLPNRFKEGKLRNKRRSLGRRYGTQRAVARELRMQGSGFMSKVEWKKIKWAV